MLKHNLQYFKIKTLTKLSESEILHPKETAWLQQTKQVILYFIFILY